MLSVFFWTYSVTVAWCQPPKHAVTVVQFAACLPPSLSSGSGSVRIKGKSWPPHPPLSNASAHFKWLLQKLTGWISAQVHSPSSAYTCKDALTHRRISWIHSINDLCSLRSLTNGTIYVHWLRCSEYSPVRVKGERKEQGTMTVHRICWYSIYLPWTPPPTHTHTTPYTFKIPPAGQKSSLLSVSLPESLV